MVSNLEFSGRAAGDRSCCPIAERQQGPGQTPHSLSQCRDTSCTLLAPAGCLAIRYPRPMLFSPPGGHWLTGVPSWLKDTCERIAGWLLACGHRKEGGKRGFRGRWNRCEKRNNLGAVLVYTYMHVTNDELPGFLANTMPAPSLCPDYRSSFGRQRDQCARSRVSKRALPHELRGSPDLQGNFASLLALFRLQVSLPQLLGSPGEPSTNTIMSPRYVGTRA